mmetsp:Transcript_27102/g.73253  ORF Transcript_27102/g.73253 Transcript_27102/m.73253 type:complete len:123 (-) Transcript_27102:190-558(-)
MCISPPGQENACRGACSCKSVQRGAGHSPKTTPLHACLRMCLRACVPAHTCTQTHTHTHTYTHTYTRARAPMSCTYKEGSNQLHGAESMQQEHTNLAPVLLARLTMPNLHNLTLQRWEFNGP